MASYRKQSLTRRELPLSAVWHYAYVAESADLVVVGLGAVGSAALYQAAKQGARVIGIDRFTPPHDQGSSHGETRITRQAIGEGRAFVPLVLRSNEIWRELEAATGRSLMTRNGGLILATPGVKGSHHGSSTFLQDTIDAAVSVGISHEVLTAGEISRRFPQFQLTAAEQGYFEPGAGFLRPELCVQTQLEQAAADGGIVRNAEVVLTIEASHREVAVTTDKNTYRAAKVILTAGPWISRFLPKRYAAHFQVYRQTLCWFDLASNAERYSPDRFPIFIWITGTCVQDMLYGFPAVDGPNSGIKVATETYESTVDPDAVPRDVSDAFVAGMHANYIAPRLPDVSDRCLRTATCLYTVTPDGKFVIDYADENHNVVFASACSGHGFKHSPAVGEALVQRALGLPTSIDLSGFALQRLAGGEQAT
jgi:sarcosine oxidase